MTTLTDKLKSLSVQGVSLDNPRASSAHPIDQVLPCRNHATDRGEAFLVETIHPRDYRHGRCPIYPRASLRSFLEGLKQPDLPSLEPRHFAYLDTETTGLVGGTGTYAFLIGVGRFDGHQFRLAQFFMRDPIEEPAVLAALSNFLQPCRALVTFNGKAFDLPLLNTRHIVNGTHPSLAVFPNIDLLPIARRIWRHTLSNRSLGNLEEKIIGAERTHLDVPGWMIPGIYFDYLRSGDGRPLKSVFYHNAMDILSLAALFNHLARMLEDPINRVVFGPELYGIGTIYEDLGHFEAAAGIYEQGLNHPLPEDVRDKILRKLSYLERRRGNLSGAVDLWLRSARHGKVYAHVELAKYHEHKRRDYRRAKQWTLTAIDLVNQGGLPPYNRGRWLRDLDRRLGRLRRKADKSAFENLKDAGPFSRDTSLRVS